LVLGGGSGGLACAKACSELGRRVAVVDYVTPTPTGTSWGLGGTCVNVGCIPKKLMHQAGLVGEALADAEHYGWEPPLRRHDWHKLVAKVGAHVKSLNTGYESELRDKAITYFNALGRFVDPHTLVLQTASAGPALQSVSARRIVLATGGRPVYPPIPGAEEYGITSDDLFQLKADPGAVLVVGGSYVALECAGFLHAMGKAVTVMMRSIPLRGFDQEMAEKVVSHMASLGVTFLRPAIPVRVELVGGRRHVAYTFAGAVEELVAEFDTVLFATGRRPCTSGVGLDVAGVCLSSRGTVLVNQRDQTTAPHIYAIGDIVEGGPELTPVAIQAGRLLAQRLFNAGTAIMDYNNVPTTVFTPLEYGCCGLTEEAAGSAFGETNVEVYHTTLAPLEWQLPQRDSEACYMKVICHAADSMRVVGIHMLCPNAGEIIQGLAVAMQAGICKPQLDATIGIHPTVAEAVTAMKITKRSAVVVAKGGC